MKKFFAVICVLFSVCFLFAGCGEDGEPFLIDMLGRNFFKSEFDENYTHYEDELKAGKKAKTISVTGNVTSGIIGLKIVEKVKDGQTGKTYEFTITDSLNETIVLDKKHSGDWLIISDHNADTEGGFEAAVFG